MSGLLLIVYITAIALSAMVLGLAITFSVFHKAKWISWYIVFQACIFGTIVLGCFELVSNAFFKPEASIVFSYIFKIMMHTTMGVVCVLIPCFLKWMINTRWNNFHKVVFFALGIIYFGIGLVSVLTKNEVIAVIVQSAIIFVIYVFCVIELWVNLNNIPNEQSRGVCLAFNITSLCMMPLLVVSFIFEDVRKFSYPGYVIAFSIVMLVYFFIRFDLDSKRKVDPHLDQKAFERFKVTEREYAVIKLVCDGLTNKEIASELNISVNTVNNHVANIFEKVGARSRVDLLKMMKSDPWE